MSSTRCCSLRLTDHRSAALLPHGATTRHRAGTGPRVVYDHVVVDQPPILTPATPLNPIGDAASLRRIYDEHGATVYRFCCQSLPTHLAEEATQDVFLQAWRNRDRFDPARGAMIAWLIGIAKLRVIDLARHEQRHSRRRADIAQPGSVGQPNQQAAESLSLPGDEQIDRLATKAVVGDALRRLPERQRSVVALAYVEGLTHQEIASRTDMPLGTVKSDIRRGLQSIRQHLEGTDV